MAARRKRPVRRTKKTILTVGEGLTEKAFQRYVKELCITRGARIEINARVHLKRRA